MLISFIYSRSNKTVDYNLKYDSFIYNNTNLRILSRYQNVTLKRKEELFCKINLGSNIYISYETDSL